MTSNRTSERNNEMKNLYFWAAENVDKDQDGMLMVHLLESIC